MPATLRGLEGVSFGGKQPAFSRAKAHAYLSIGCDENEIVVDGDILIRGLPHGAGGISHPDFFVNHWLFIRDLEITSELEKVYPCSSDDFQERSDSVFQQIDEVLSGFRLFKEGAAAYVGLSFRPIADNKAEQAALDSNGPAMVVWDRPSMSELPRYAFSTSEVGNLHKLLSKIRERRLVSEFFFQRFMGSYSKSAADMALDSIICMEALFAPEKAPEVSYRFRMRGAVRLEQDVTKRQELYEQLKLMYDLRSAIVHGQFKQDQKSVKELQKKLNVQSLEDIARAIQNVARRAVLRYLDDPSLFVCKALDSFLLGDVSTGDTGSTSSSASSTGPHEQHEANE